MITFKQFICESDDFDLEKFTEDCDFFLSEMKGSSSLLWRGVRQPPSDYSILPFMERTKALDMPPLIHTFLNSYYRERIGYPIRNWLFATGNKRSAAEYTSNYKPSLLFPIGEFSWFCFKDPELKDLWLYVDKIRSHINNLFSNKREAEFELYDSLERALDVAEFWFNEDLKACIESGNEVMISCKEYYLFNPYKSFDTHILPYLVDKGIIRGSMEI